MSLGTALPGRIPSSLPPTSFCPGAASLRGPPAKAQVHLRLVRLGAPGLEGGEACLCLRVSWPQFSHL